MLAKDSNEQNRQGGFSVFVNAGRGVAELMAECRKCGAITMYGSNLLGGFTTSRARSAQRRCDASRLVAQGTSHRSNLRANEARERGLKRSPVERASGFDKVASARVRLPRCAARMIVLPEEAVMRQMVLNFLIAATATGSALAEVRLSNDFPAGSYVSAYTIATGIPYTDPTLSECSRARGRQNEPSVGVNPRNINVIIGSSNDYCGVYNDGSDADGAPIASGPIWLGYYRSENRGASFQSSLVPGYPGDASPYAALAHIRTASAGDPVIAWDGHGRVFMGSESSDDPAGSKKTFGDVWVGRFDNPDGENGDTLNDGKRFLGSEVVAKGSSAPNLLGKFHDKTAIEADRTGGRCDANVYFAWARFTGVGISNIYFSRSVDHGVAKQPVEPGDGGFVIANRIRLADTANERVLKDVLGGRSISNTMLEKGEERAVVCDQRSYY